MKMFKIIILDGNMYISYRNLIGLRVRFSRVPLSRDLFRFLSRFEAASILEISEKSSKKEIKKAYLKKAKILHPDNKV